MRIFELAKELDIDSEDLLGFCWDLAIGKPKNKASSLRESEIDTVKTCQDMGVDICPRKAVERANKALDAAQAARNVAKTTFAAAKAAEASARQAANEAERAAKEQAAAQLAASQAAHCSTWADSAAKAAALAVGHALAAQAAAEKAKGAAKEAMDQQNAADAAAREAFDGASVAREGINLPRFPGAIIKAHAGKGKAEAARVKAENAAAEAARQAADAQGAATAAANQAVAARGAAQAVKALPPPLPPLPPVAFQAVGQRIDHLLVRQGFQATDDPTGLTTTWARDPQTDGSTIYPLGFWVEWSGPRWILTGNHPPGELWFGVEEELLGNALRRALSRQRHGQHVPADLFTALAQLGGTVQGLQDWVNWRRKVPFDGRTYLAGQYGVSLNDQNLEQMVWELVDGLVVFLCHANARPWHPTGAGVCPYSVKGTRIPVPIIECPLFSFVDLAAWLANDLHGRGYTIMGPTEVMDWMRRWPATVHAKRDDTDYKMTSSLSWNKPASGEDRLVKLVHRLEGVYWFAFRDDYAAKRQVPNQLFDQKHLFDNVYFRGFWVRNSPQSQQRILGVLKYL